MKKNEGEVYPVMKKIFSSEIQNWQNITLDSMQFFFQQAEKYLNNIRDNLQSLDSKATSLLTANTAFLIPLLGVCFFALQKDIWGMFLFTIIASICFIISAIFCFIVIYPNSIACSGSAPRYLMNPLFIKEEQKGNIQVLQIMMNECEAYQDRIDILHSRNKYKVKRIRLAVALTWIAPLLGGLGFIIYLFSRGSGSLIIG